MLFQTLNDTTEQKIFRGAIGRLEERYKKTLNNVFQKREPFKRKLFHKLMSFESNKFAPNIH